MPAGEQVLMMTIHYAEVHRTGLHLLSRVLLRPGGRASLWPLPRRRDESVGARRGAWL